jgi:O-antigen biosynthesis protein
MSREENKLPPMRIRLLAALRRLKSPKETIAMGQRILARFGIKFDLPKKARQFKFPKQGPQAAVTHGPTISVVTPVYRSNLIYLSLCIGSVLKQNYQNWELLLIDDGSHSSVLRAFLKLASQIDRRIQVISLVTNQGIASATNAGIEAASGEWVGFLDHDDCLVAGCLAQVADYLRLNPQCKALYTDEVKIDGFGRIIGHHFKPDWSPVFACGVMYPGHFLVAQRQLAKDVGGINPDFNGVQDFEFALRLQDQAGTLHHLASPLYCWRAIKGSLALQTNAKQDIDALQRRAVADHLVRRGLAWSARTVAPHRLLLGPGTVKTWPKISIIIPSKNQGPLLKACLTSIFTHTLYPNFDVIIVDNQTTEEDALQAMAAFPVTRLKYDRPFNYSAANNLGVEHSNAHLILLLNNDTEVLEPDWLEQMAFCFEDPEIGAVGTKLIYDSGHIQHAGVVLGARGTADHAMRGFPAHVDGYNGSLICSREVSAVTAACMMIRRRDYLDVGGLNTDFARHYQDIDFCLKLRARGMRIISLASPTLKHHESASRNWETYDFGDRALLIDRWADVIAKGDPYYNRRLDVETLDYGVGPERAGL